MKILAQCFFGCERHFLEVRGGVLKIFNNTFN